MLRKLPLRYLGALLVTLLLLTAVGSTAAAPLSGGNTVYVINGEETTFTFDPITRKDGTLLPMDVFAALGISVSQADKTVVVLKAGVQAHLTLGQSVGTIGKTAITVAPVPLKLSGRLFLPATVLEELGYEVMSESGYVQIRDLTQGINLNSDLDRMGYDNLKYRLTANNYLEADDGKTNLGVETTFLTPELLASGHFPATFKERVQYLNLLQTHSLLMVRVVNHSGRGATLNPASLMLLDKTTLQQYDVEQTLDYRGLINAKIASGAGKTSILVYPKVDAATSSLYVFSDTSSATLGPITIK